MVDRVVEVKVDFFFCQGLCSYIKEILHGLNFMSSTVKHFRKNLFNWSTEFWKLQNLHKGHLVYNNSGV